MSAPWDKEIFDDGSTSVGSRVENPSTGVGTTTTAGGAANRIIRYQMLAKRRVDVMIPWTVDIRGAPALCTCDIVVKRLCTRLPGLC